MSEKFDYINHYKIDAEEFNYFEERKGATKHDETRVHEYILSKINKTPKFILDVGSGSAWVAKELKNQGHKVVSLDISLKNVKTAKHNFKGENHYQLVADSFCPPLKRESFDVIIASEVIEHVLEPKKFVDLLIELVKPSGKLIITTPYKEKLKYYLCIHCNNKTPVHAHIHSFDEKKLISYYPSKYEYKTFGNKFLIFLRTYIILQIFPFRIWKFIDDIFNYIFKAPVHIMIEYHK